MTLLDRYILKKLLDSMILGLVLFTLVLFFSDALLDFMKDLQHYGIGYDIAFTLIGLQIPRIVAIVVPMSALLAVLLTYNNLSNHFEIIALRMSGISLYRIAFPALILGIFASIFTFILHDYLVPISNKYANSLKVYAINEQNLPSTHDNFTYKQFDDKSQLTRLLYVTHFHHTQLGYTTLVDLTNPLTLQVIQARSGDWGHRMIELNQANIYTVTTNQRLANTTQAESLQLQNFIKAQRPVSEYEPKELSFFGLQKWIQHRIANHIKVKPSVFVIWWEKLTVPLSSLPLVLIAVPLAMTTPRQLNNLGFILAIGILLLYYILRHISVQLGDEGYIWPLLAASLPIILIGTGAGILFERKNRVL